MTASWTRERLRLTLSTTEAPLGVLVEELVELAVRRNPRRAHLLVSRVLGKHLPTDPRLVSGAGRLLGLRVAEALGAPVSSAPLGPLLAAALRGDPGASAALRDATLLEAAAVPGTVVLGNAETATALGHCVADVLAARYLHSTRRPAPGLDPIGGFAEPHSHAAVHLLQPTSPAMLGGDGVLVIVDDELSTGVTALNTVEAVHARWPHARYVVAALVDLRGAADEARLTQVARRLGVRIDVVSLARGELATPPDVVGAGAALAASLAPPARSAAPARCAVERLEPGWPAEVAESGRHGAGPADHDALEAALPAVLDRVARELPARPLRVLATEEFMYLPLRIAEGLADRGVPVRYSTTTRSPVLAVDADGYPIRTALLFGSHDLPADGAGPRFAYNVAGSDEDVLVVTDSPADTDALATGLLDQLTRVARRVLLAVVPVRAPLPEPLRGPAFGSYRADEVGWLLQDLSAARLEAPTEEREEAIQAGGAHYAESLPVEYQPDEAYYHLFHEALADSALRLAHAVGVVTEIVLAERGHDVVLASLARAGTPVGVLVRRWAAFAHGLDVPHYAVSIVRGRGIDAVALRYLAAQHDPSRVVFLDGWTGKGAIARELDAAVEAANGALGTAFRAELAVLADPGSCVRTFGTREDYLIPSACLNSTVSGLVSRTVLNDRLVSPARFHGAKFYAELAAADVSGAFLDAVSARFGAVAPDVARDWPIVRSGDRTPTWAGWQAIEAISERYDIGSANLVKPGVGETTRVLLRRVPWRVLVRPGSGAELKHILLLAEQRGVPVEEVDGLPYSCVGLIHPRFTRAATGSEGTVVT